MKSPRAVFFGFLSLTSAVALVAAFTTSGCDSIFGCTEIGCDDGFVVTFARSSWTPGEYVFSADMDGEVSSVTITLDETSCDPIVTDQGPEFIELVITSCTDPANWSMDIDYMFLSTTAEAVDLTVTQDGDVLGIGVLTPTYDEERPNGRGCEPVCLQADPLIVTLDDP